MTMKSEQEKSKIAEYDYMRPMTEIAELLWAAKVWREREKENNVCWEKLKEWEVERTESSQWSVLTFTKKGLEKKLLSSTITITF